MSEQDNLVTALMNRYGLDKASANSVLAHAKSLSAPDRKPNDYALAKALNERVTDIIGLSSSELDITAINKSYVLMVNELKKLYERTAELSSIGITPIWKVFDIIEGAEYEISQYLNDWNTDTGQSHNAKVNKLCIIAGKETPEYTPELKQIIKEADNAIATYRKRLDELQSKSKASERDWHIPEYSFTCKPDGTLLVNGVSGVLKVKKTQAGSASARLLEQAIANPDTLFKPALGNYSRNLSTTLSGLGFSGTLRDLFFPQVSEDKGLIYRPNVTRAKADAERIDTADLDFKLKQLGADTATQELSLADIPF